MKLKLDRLLRRRIRATLMQLKYGEAIRRARHFALFIGYPRSGHTLVASLLDAHEKMLFANGLDAAAYLSSGFNVQQVAALSIWNSLRFTASGRRSNGYDYTVPEGWHGRWGELQVIGDKSGDLFSESLRRDSSILQSVLHNLAGKGKFIHVVRNPYDAISSIASRGGIGLQAASGIFFALCEANARAREAISRSAWMDLHLEDLIHQPESSLHQLCAFLGQEATDSYVAGCRNLILESPRRSSSAMSWDAGLAREVSDQMDAFPWFDGYCFARPERVPAANAPSRQVSVSQRRPSDLR